MDGESDTWFTGRTVFIMEDNDRDGHNHATVLDLRLAHPGRTGEQLQRICRQMAKPEPVDILRDNILGPDKLITLARQTAGHGAREQFILCAALREPVRNIAAGRELAKFDNPDLLRDLAQMAGNLIDVACVTTGITWPDGANGQGRRSVIMLTAEDTLDDTLVPRLIAAGADLTRVRFLKSIHKDDNDRMFLLGEDLDSLEDAIREVGEVGLVSIDPITAYLGKINSHMATDVRAQLGPLKDFSERVGVGISAITHPPKNAGPRALDQFIGSQAYIAAARLGHLCVEEFEQEAIGNRPTGRMLYTLAKHNPIKPGKALAYRIVDAIGGVDRRTTLDVKTSKIVWEGPVESPPTRPSPRPRRARITAARLGS